MKGCGVMKETPNIAVRTMNHELRTLKKKELRFSYAIISPESKTSYGKVKKRTVSAVTGVKVHQTFTIFSPK
jgi:hypothetical protein